MRSKLVRRAILFGERKHAGQVRRYTGEPYFHHCQEVAAKVAICDLGEVAVCTALLHDTLEDTATTFDELEAEFGHDVATLVRELTDVSTSADGNRKARKAKDLAHTAAGSPLAHSIKLADLISNTKSIVEHDKSFAKIYLKEKRALLEVLLDGHAGLFAEATQLLRLGETALDVHYGVGKW